MTASKRSLFDLRSTNCCRYKPVAAPQGTTITLNGIFARYPVRRKVFFKDRKKNLHKMKIITMAYALLYPNTRFTFRVIGAADTITFQGDMRQKVGQLYGSSKVLGLTEGIIKFSGWTWSYVIPNEHNTENSGKSTWEYTLVAVNGLLLDSSLTTTRKIVKHINRHLTSRGTVVNGIWVLAISNVDSHAFDRTLEPSKDDLIFQDLNLFLESVDQFFARIFEPEESMDEDITLNDIDCECMTADTTAVNSELDMMADTTIVEAEPDMMVDTTAIGAKPRKNTSSQSSTSSFCSLSFMSTMPNSTKESGSKLRQTFLLPQVDLQEFVTSPHLESNSISPDSSISRSGTRNATNDRAKNAFALILDQASKTQSTRHKISKHHSSPRTDIISRFSAQPADISKISSSAKRKSSINTPRPSSTRRFTSQPRSFVAAGNGRTSSTPPPTILDRFLGTSSLSATVDRTSLRSTSMQHGRPSQKVITTARAGLASVNAQKGILSFARMSKQVGKPTRDNQFIVVRMQDLPKPMVDEDENGVLGDLLCGELGGCFKVQSEGWMFLL